jgi:hypothetical protein
VVTQRSFAARKKLGWPAALPTAPGAFNGGSRGFLSIRDSFQRVAGEARKPAGAPSTKRPERPISAGGTASEGRLWHEAFLADQRFILFEAGPVFP